MKPLIGALCAFVASACLLASLAVAFSTQDTCDGTFHIPEPPTDDAVKTAICQLGDFDLPTLTRETCQLSTETVDNAVRKFFNLPPFGNTFTL
jgi:hypothetical protein